MQQELADQRRDDLPIHLQDVAMVSLSFLFLCPSLSVLLFLCFSFSISCVVSMAKGLLVEMSPVVVLGSSRFTDATRSFSRLISGQIAG